MKIPPDDRRAVIVLRRLAVISLFAAASLTLTGCASTGVQVDEAAVAKFEPGKTTYVEVVKALGPPTTSMVRSDGHRVILYTYAQARMRAATLVPLVGLFAGGMDTTSSNVSFEFDTHGVMINDSTSQTQLGAGTGLITGAAHKGSLTAQPRIDKP
jgi:outer membrane protein assembly factor BamE (lipoprotein component of BamABCDE complex)